VSALCRQSALRFLKIRPRSIVELRSKLELKSFDAEDIEHTLTWLQQIQLLDDRAFTKSWIQYRLARPFGFRRIIEELKQKGVAADILQEEIDLVKEDTDELKTALEIAARRWQKFERVEPLKRKKRIFDFLIRRGFSPDTVMKVIKKL
jgi:regulatory protein